MVEEKVKSGPKDLSDGELAGLAQNGSAAAFEEIYDRHAPGIARALASFAGPDRDVLEDLTQDVFFRVVDRIGLYRPSHPFTNWLYTIALNVGRNHVRQRAKVVSLDPAEFDGIPSGKESGTDWSDEILEITLVRLVTRLPDYMREVMSLRIGSEMPFAEIADVLGIPEGTARSRMFNAVKILREKLGITGTKKEIK